MLVSCVWAHEVPVVRAGPGLEQVGKLRPVDAARRRARPVCVCVCACVRACVWRLGRIVHILRCFLPHVTSCACVCVCARAR